MSESEFYQWRLFFPLIFTEEKKSFSLRNKLNFVSIENENLQEKISVKEFYFLLSSGDATLKIRPADLLEIEIEIRNRNRPTSISRVESWSRFQLKPPRFELSEQIRARLDRSFVERIEKFIENFLQREKRDELSSIIEFDKSISLWRNDENDRIIEQTDFTLSVNNRTFDESVLPKNWRTIAVRTSDQQQLNKTLTTLQIDDDKDLFDYFSFLVCQTRFHSTNPDKSLPSTRTFMDLLTISYASFIELIQRLIDEPSFNQ